MMVQAAHLRDGDHTGIPRLDLPWDGCVPLQREMRAGLVVVVDVGFENPAEMALAKDDDVIQTFPPDRANHPFHVGVLPG